MELASRFKQIVIVEENAKAGGFSSAVVELFVDQDVLDGHHIKRLGIPDQFIEHGTQKELREEIGIDKNGMKKAMLELLGKK